MTIAQLIDRESRCLDRVMEYRDAIQTMAGFRRDVSENYWSSLYRAEFELREASRDVLRENLKASLEAAE
jgi:hypothetical protein